MSEEEIKDMILKQCLELNTNNDLRSPISSYDGVDIDDVVRTCKQLQDKKTYLDLVKENQELKDKLEFYSGLELDKTIDKTRLEYNKLQKENKQLKEVIEEVREYIEKTPISSILEVHCGYEEEYTKPLLQILDKVKEDTNNG